jgi:hypothetical protein
MNSFGTDERNCLQLDTVKSTLIVITNYEDVSCSEFFDIISKDRKVLEKIHSSCKFKDDTVVSSGEREIICRSRTAINHAPKARSRRGKEDV